MFMCEEKTKKKRKLSNVLRRGACAPKDKKKGNMSHVSIQSLLGKVRSKVKSVAFKPRLHQGIIYCV